MADGAPNIGGVPAKEVANVIERRREAALTYKSMGEGFAKTLRDSIGRLRRKVSLHKKVEAAAAASASAAGATSKPEGSDQRSEGHEYFERRGELLYSRVSLELKNVTSLMRCHELVSRRMAIAVNDSRNLERATELEIEIAARSLSSDPEESRRILQRLERGEDM